MPGATADAAAIGVSNLTGTPEPFHRSPNNPAETLVKLEAYLKRTNLLFRIHKHVAVDDDQKCVLLQIWGGTDMVYLWEKVASPPIADDTTYADACKALKSGLGSQTNAIFPFYEFFTKRAQGSKSIQEYMTSMQDAAKLLKLSTHNCEHNLTADRAVVLAIVFQTSNDKL